MKIITLWYSIRNHGDGSAYPHWFGSQATANKDQELQEEGWGESCTGSIQSFEGSDEHESALENDKLQAIRLRLMALEEEEPEPVVVVGGELVTITRISHDGIYYRGKNGNDWAYFADIEFI